MQYILYVLFFVGLIVGMSEFFKISVAQVLRDILVVILIPFYLVSLIALEFKKLIKEKS